MSHSCFPASNTWPPPSHFFGVSNGVSMRDFHLPSAPSPQYLSVVGTPLLWTKCPTRCATSLVSPSPNVHTKRTESYLPLPAGSAPSTRVRVLNGSSGPAREPRIRRRPMCSTSRPSLHLTR